MNQNKVLSMLGLATRAGKVVSGEFAVEKSVKCGTACLVMIAQDSSDNTKKMFTNMCSFYEVPLVIWGSKEELGHAIGKEYRASLAVQDEGFVKSIQKHLQEIDK